MHALELDRGSFPREYHISSGWSGNEDEQDAAIAAVYAREGFNGHWRTDLAAESCRHESVQDPMSYWLKPMRYFWPDDLTGMPAT